MICQMVETENSIKFRYRDCTEVWPPPPIVTTASRNVVNGYVYLGNLGAPLGRDECLRLAEWLIRQAREMEKGA